MTLQSIFIPDQLRSLREVEIIDVIFQQILHQRLHDQSTCLQKTSYSLDQVVIAQTSIINMCLEPLANLRPCQLKDVEILCQEFGCELNVLVFAAISLRVFAALPNCNARPSELSTSPIADTGSIPEDNGTTGERNAGVYLTLQGWKRIEVAYRRE